MKKKVKNEKRKNHDKDDNEKNDDKDEYKLREKEI